MEWWQRDRPRVLDPEQHLLNQTRGAHPVSNHRDCSCSWCVSITPPYVMGWVRGVQSLMTNEPGLEPPCSWRPKSGRFLWPKSTHQMLKASDYWASQTGILYQHKTLHASVTLKSFIQKHAELFNYQITKDQSPRLMFSPSIRPSVKICGLVFWVIKETMRRFIKDFHFK